MEIEAEVLEQRKHTVKLQCRGPEEKDDKVIVKKRKQVELV